MKNEKAFKVNTVTLDKSGAAEALSRYGNYEYQRKINNDAVKEYSEKMVNGEFLGDSILTMAENEETGKICLVDGYQRLNALSCINSGFELGFDLRFYKCKNSVEVDKLYEACTSLSRTKNDYIDVKSKRLGLSGKIITNVLSWAINYTLIMNKRSFHVFNGKNAEKANVLDNKIDLANFLNSMRNDYILMKDNVQFNNSNISFCIAYTYESLGESIARSFWSDVFSLGEVRGDGKVLDYSNPARTFRRRIIKDYQGRAGGSWNYSSGKKEEVALLFQSAIKAWLAGKNLEILKTNSVFDWEAIDVTKLARKIAK